MVTLFSSCGNAGCGTHVGQMAAIVPVPWTSGGRITPHGRKPRANEATNLTKARGGKGLRCGAVGLNKTHHVVDYSTALFNMDTFCTRLPDFFAPHPSSTLEPKNEDAVSTKSAFPSGHKKRRDNISSRNPGYPLPTS